MIRRDIVDSEGRPAWALISQVEHARIAGEMAAAWNDDFARLPLPRDEFLAAVDHHDDGWIPWELHPTVCDGRPRDFLEMPFDESLAIWRRSIAVARGHGPSAAYAVSGHFSALCARARDSKSHDDSWLHLAEDFLEEQADLRSHWRRECELRGKASKSCDAELERAVHGLQFFDLASLWLCCAERSAAEKVGATDFIALTWSPRTEPAAEGFSIGVDPWPFRSRQLTLAVAAKIVPQLDYADDGRLKRAIEDATADPRSIRWQLCPT